VGGLRRGRGSQSPDTLPVWRIRTAETPALYGQDGEFTIEFDHDLIFNMDKRTGTSLTTVLGFSDGIVKYRCNVA